MVPSAVGLMPVIGGGGGAHAGGHVSRHPTDAELKQQIAALQSRAALSYNPDQSEGQLPPSENHCLCYCSPQPLPPAVLASA